MEELYIDDDDFTVFYAKVTEVHNALEARLGDIINEIAKTCVAVGEGDFHTNLVAFHGKLVETQGDLNELTSYMMEKASTFLALLQKMDNSNLTGVMV